MIDYSVLAPVLWLLPVSLQIVLPLLILLCWAVIKIPYELFRNVYSLEPKTARLERY